uniref:(northern house mosquito) hypothetical protein n=1 Tax=Culex pipiens TaxID=7175 RepID=A0A8D8P1C1_CULPI
MKTKRRMENWTSTLTTPETDGNRRRRWPRRSCSRVSRRLGREVPVLAAAEVQSFRGWARRATRESHQHHRLSAPQSDRSGLKIRRNLDGKELLPVALSFRDIRQDLWIRMGIAKRPWPLPATKITP